MPIVAAFATSHAYAFQEPETWDQRRERSKANVARRSRQARRPTRALALAETLEDNRTRYARIRGAHEEIRRRLKALKADAVILIGDDQAENFTADNMPQLLVYTGGDYVADDWDRKHTATVSEPSARSRERPGRGLHGRGLRRGVGERVRRTASSCRTRIPSPSSISSAKRPAGGAALRERGASTVADA